MYLFRRRMTRIGFCESMFSRVFLIIFVLIFSFSFIFSVYALQGNQGSVNIVIEGGISSPSPSSVEGPSGLFNTPEFTVDQEIIKVAVRRGESYSKPIIIKNPSNYPLSFELSTNLDNFISIEDNYFTVSAGGERSAYLFFTAPKIIEPGVYTGKLVIKTQYSKKEIPIIYEIKSEITYFDASVRITAEFKNVNAEDNLNFQINLFNFVNIGKVDVLMEHGIKDFEGNIIVNYSEVVSVKDQTSFSRSILIPKDISQGDYALFVKVSYLESTTTASDLFSVGKRAVSIGIFLMAIFLFLAVLTILILLYEIRQYKLKHIIRRQIIGLNSINNKLRSRKLRLVEALAEIKNLQLQKELLYESYNLGYMSKGVYESQKKRLNDMVLALHRKYK